MAYVRRHWFLSVLYGLGIIFGLAILLAPTLFSDNAPEAARAQVAESQPIDPHLYTRVQALRQEYALTGQDLAAMGCSEASAIQILETLKSWAAGNETLFNQQHRSEIQAQAAVRNRIRQINVGSTDRRASSALPALQQELAVLRKQRKATLDTLLVQVEAKMDAYQRQTWKSARENAGLPVQLRFTPGLTDQQRQNLGRRLADREAQGTRSEAIGSELTYSQKQAIDSTRINIATKSSEVRRAEAAVLPVPKLLQDQRKITLLESNVVRPRPR